MLETLKKLGKSLSESLAKVNSKTLGITAAIAALFMTAVGRAEDGVTPTVKIPDLGIDYQTVFDALATEYGYVVVAVIGFFALTAVVGMFLSWLRRTKTA